MPISPEQLARQLERGLAPVYLVSGDEPLLADECSAAIRARVRAAGYGERSAYTVESGFDWDELRAATRSLSLFSERRLIELRLPTGRPGEAGAELIAALAADPSSDIVLLIQSAKLDKGNRDSRWVQAVESAGVHVQVWPLEARQLPAWLTQRFAARGLQPEAGVVEMIAWHLEGNLLAAAQEVDKLGMLVGQGTVRLADAEASLADSARFNVYQLVDAALAGNAAVTCRMLASLRAEGTEPILMLWALARELRNLVQLAQERARGKPESAVVARVWQNRRPLVTRALRRLPLPAWYGLLHEAARLDRVIKGQAAGDRWLELERLLLAMGGLRLGAPNRTEMNA
jgi:DNA polymerase-3 subunit delta